MFIYSQLKAQVKVLTHREHGDVTKRQKYLSNIRRATEVQGPSVAPEENKSRVEMWVKWMHGDAGGRD